MGMMAHADGGHGGEEPEEDGEDDIKDEEE